MVDRLVLISGCSGGGKSTLLAELHTRGYPVVEEPGRRIVRRERESGGQALPWADPVAFLRRAMEMALADWEAAQAHPGWVFFDRGLIDAAAALDELTGAATLSALDAERRDHRRVFLPPPWPEIYRTDAERQHAFETALPEYHRLERALPALGYEVVVPRKAPASARADFVLASLAA